MVSAINIPATATSGTAMDWQGGTGALFIAGTFDGATFTLEYSPNGGTTYFTVTEKYASSNNIAPSSKAYKIFELPPGKLRLTRSSGTSPASMVALVGSTQETVRLY